MRKNAWIGWLLLAPLWGGCGAQPEETADAAAPLPEVVVRFALQPNPENKAWVAANLVRHELQRRSGGRIRVLFYDSGVLGSERQLLETCYLGVVEMVQCTSSVVTTIDPAFALLDMPYLFLDEAHHQKVLGGPIGQELLDGLRRHRLQGLAFYSCGFRHVFNARGREIRGPDDLAGLKIRVMESPVMIHALNAMGASATPLSAGELFQALKTGVVGAAENNPQVFLSEKFHEAGCLNFSLTCHFANQHVLVVNRDWFDRLARTHPDLHRLFREVARDVIDGHGLPAEGPPEVTRSYNQQWSEAVETALRQMRSLGVTVNEVEDLGPFVGRVQPVYDVFFQKHDELSPELVDHIRREAQP